MCLLSRSIVMGSNHRKVNNGDLGQSIPLSLNQEQGANSKCSINEPKT